MRRTALGLAIACAACAVDPSPAPSASLTGALPPTLAQVAPSAALASPAPDTSIRVLVAGDVMPHRPMLLDPASLSRALEPLRPLFDSADAVVANYETATGDPGDLADESRHIALAAPPAWMHALADARVTALSVANNHACDLGAAGLDATIREASADGLAAIGADARDPWRARVLAEGAGHRVCAVAWSTFVNAPIPGCADSGRIAVADFKKRGLARLEHAVARARADGGCDAVVAILHGGDEYEPQAPGPLLQAKRAAFAGADAVVIHHPHVPSPLETIVTPDGRRVPVFASVGNLVSNQGESWKPPYHPVRADRHVISLNAWTRLGVIADLRWRWAHGAPPGTRGELEWGYHLVWIENEHATDRAIKVPRIEARLFDFTADRPLEDLLTRDEGGPIALFRDPCWIEAGGAGCR